jgi:hypothetical protein
MESEWDCNLRVQQGRGRDRPAPQLPCAIPTNPRSVQLERRPAEPAAVSFDPAFWALLGTVHGGLLGFVYSLSVEAGYLILPESTGFAPLGARLLFYLYCCAASGLTGALVTTAFGTVMHIGCTIASLLAPPGQQLQPLAGPQRRT